MINCRSTDSVHYKYILTVIQTTRLQQAVDYRDYLSLLKDSFTIPVKAHTHSAFTVNTAVIIWPN